MLLTLRRLWHSDLSTQGKLSTEGFSCFTLEPAKPIPAGKYKVILAKSPRLGYVTPRYLGVPGEPNDDILIHIGNFPKDTKGCTLVGSSKGDDYINNSTDTFHSLMAVLQKAESDIYINITEG